MELVDQVWLPDWQALLAAEQLSEGGAGERELAELVLEDEVGRYSWTCTDWAMTLVRCSACDAEPATGPVDCLRCSMAEAARWSWDHSSSGRITPSEHALRVARAVLRAPHRSRDVVAATWRLLIPFLLVGELATAGQVQRLRAQVLAGQYEDLAACATHERLVGLPEIYWRRDEDARGDHQVRLDHPRGPRAPSPVEQVTSEA